MLQVTVKHISCIEYTLIRAGIVHKTVIVIGTLAMGYQDSTLPIVQYQSKLLSKWN